MAPFAPLPVPIASPGAFRNRYLITAAGADVSSRLRSSVASFGPLAGGPLLGLVAGVVGALVGSDLIWGLGVCIGFVMFIAGVIMAWVFLLAGSRDNNTAGQQWMMGNYTDPIPLCQKSLSRVFRADVRIRALYTIGLCAEANGDFLEAHDLFRRAFGALPALAAAKWKRRAQCMILSHSAIALVALGRLDEADQAIRMASAFFPLLPTSGVLDALNDDSGFGAVGVSAALRDLEPGRDHRALLSLATLVVLTARGLGREALELAGRERHALVTGLFVREQALLANVEACSHAILSAGPMRGAGHAMSHQADPISAAWAQRIMPVRG